MGEYELVLCIELMSFVYNLRDIDFQKILARLYCGFLSISGTLCMRGSVAWFF